MSWRRAILGAFLAVPAPLIAQTNPQPPPITVIDAPQNPPAVPQKPATYILARADKDETCSRTSDVFGSEIHAGGGSDRIWAGDADGKLFGDEDDDFLAGGPGNDEIHGGTDGDIMVGGAGSDLFVYDSIDDSPTDENGEWSPISGDTVADFTPPDFDKFDLRQIDRAGSQPPASFRWSGRRAVPYGVWVQPRMGDTVVLVDADGNALADLAIRLIGTITLQATDFCGVALAPR